MLPRSFKLSQLMITLKFTGKIECIGVSCTLVPTVIVHIIFTIFIVIFMVLFEIDRRSNIVPNLKLRRFWYLRAVQAN